MDSEVVAGLKAVVLLCFAVACFVRAGRGHRDGALLRLPRRLRRSSPVGRQGGRGRRVPGPSSRGVVALRLLRALLRRVAPLTLPADGPPGGAQPVGWRTGACAANNNTNNNNHNNIKNNNKSIIVIE